MIEKKICKTCKQEKNITEFHNAGRYTVNGEEKIRRRARCKLCVNQNWKERKEKLLNEIIGEHKCRRCGYDRFIGALEFHHLDSDEKDFNIAQRWTVSKERLANEINKCVMLCSICHRELHGGLWDIEELGL